MGQAEANELRPGALVCYWLLVPEAGLPKFEICGPVAVVDIKRADVPACAVDAPNPKSSTAPEIPISTPRQGHVQAVKLADSPCWVRREFLISNIHEA